MVYSYLCRVMSVFLNTSVRLAFLKMYGVPVAFFKYGFLLAFLNMDGKSDFLMKPLKFKNRTVSKYIRFLFDKFRRNIGVFTSFGSF